MVVDPSEFIRFGDWFWEAIVPFLLTIVTLLVGGLAFWFVQLAVRRHPRVAVDIIGRTLHNSIFRDLPSTSLRRILAMARLAIHEALRSRVLVIFVIFVVLLLFGGWFLDVENDHPARLYLTFVLSSTSYLIIALAMFLSAFSLPNDIKNRTIYTITTKPVRSHEIFMGRVIGFAAVGTILLLMMGTISYMFVWRGLDHTHTIDVADLNYDSDRKEWTGRTSFDRHHFHDVIISNETKRGIAMTSKGHQHEITVVGEGTDVQFEVGPPVGDLLARVPVYGELSFLDRYGNQAESGLNVGKSWGYRTYIEGNTLNTAIWKFGDQAAYQITSATFPDEKIPLEMDLRVFRTNRGDIESKIRGEVILMSTDPIAKVQESLPINFEATEFATLRMDIPFSDVKYLDPISAKPISVDVFNDLIVNGELKVGIRCKEHAQFFGMARADLYLRGPDQSFIINFAKSYVGIWMQMLLVTLFGVLFSTFLNGIISLKATLAIIVLGTFAGFITAIQTDDVSTGGGPIEALVRGVTQQGAETELNVSDGARDVIEALDGAYLWTMNVVSQIAPRYPEFNTADKVAYGYDISMDLLLRHLTVTLGYFMVISIIGTLILRSREVAA